MSLPRTTLVLGGARSGKSAYAEGLIRAAAPRATCLATAEAGDGEMAERIAHHQASRGAGWHTIEEPLDLVGALRRAAAPERPVLVDCLTLWLSNLMHAGRDAAVETAALASCLADLAGPVVLVSNEVGQGIVPDNALARAFRDHAGRLHQAVAAVAEQVVFVTAGLPMMLKSPRKPLVK